MRNQGAFVRGFAIAVLAAVVVGCDEPSATGADQPQEPTWVEATAGDAEPDLRFLDIEPAHLAIVATVKGAELTEEDTEGLSEDGTGAWAGTWVEDGHHFVGVAGPDADEIAARAAATVEYLGADVTVVIGRHTRDALLAAGDTVHEAGLPLVFANLDIIGNRIEVVVRPDDLEDVTATLADLIASGIVHVATAPPPPPTPHEQRGTLAVSSAGGYEGEDGPVLGLLLACQVDVDSVDVEESDDQVVVTVWGNDREAGQESRSMCATIHEVLLDRPLGDRVVFDAGSGSLDEVRTEGG